MATTNNKLPQNHTPNGELCIPVFVPNDPEWVSILMQTLEIPSLQRYWVKDGNGARDIVRRHWESSVLIPTFDSLIQGNDCSSGDNEIGNCFRMDTTTDAMLFYPNDPFLQSQNLDDDIQIASLLRWTRWGEAESDAHPVFQFLTENLSEGLGYAPNDCLLSLDPAGVFANPITKLGNFVELFTSFPFPTVTIKIEGTGQLEVELLNLPLGGSAILVPDLDLSLDALWTRITAFFDDSIALPPSWTSLELNRDIIAFPPETNSTVTVEFEFEEDTEHTMHIVFLPRFNDEAPFFFPFGGIREIEVCGDMRVIGWQTGLAYDKNKVIEGQAIRKGFVMSTIEELCEAVRCGNLKAYQEIAQRILLASDAENVLGDVTIDKDTGEQTIISPVKTFNGGFSVSQKDVYNGQARGIASGFVGLLQDVADWYDDSLSESDIVDRLVAIYGLVNPVSAVAFYIANQTSGLPAYNLDTMTRYIYEGANSATSIARYAYEETADFAQNLLLQFRSFITPDNYEEWSAKGGQTPLDDWRDYPSNLISSVEFIYDTDKLADASYISTGLLKVTSANRLMRVQFSGSAVADDGYLFDGIYLKSPSGDLTVAQYSISDFQNPFNRGWVTPNALPSYGDKVGGNYAYNMTRSHGTQSESRITLAGGVHSRDWVSGQVIMTVFDLGAL